MPFACNRLSVLKLPTFAVSVTFKLLETLTKFPVTKLPKSAFNDVTLPPKYKSFQRYDEEPKSAVPFPTDVKLPVIDPLILKLPILANPVVIRLPPLILPTTCKDVKLPTVVILD